MKKFIALVMLLAVLGLFSPLFAQVTTTAQMEPLWNSIAIVPGMLSISMSNAEVGEFADTVGRRAYTLVDTNLIQVGKALEVKVGFAAWDTQDPVLVYGVGANIMTLIQSVKLLDGLVTVQAEPIENISVSVMEGYDTENYKWELGVALVKPFVIPNPVM
jgi:hypothetical protein